MKLENNNKNDNNEREKNANDIYNDGWLNSSNRHASKMTRN